jgi:hypothetical protein
MLLTEKEKSICEFIAIIIILVFICLIMFSGIYSETMWKIVMDIIVNIANNTAILMTFVSSIALVLAYVIAYNRASRFGVPFRYVRANIHESIEIIITTVFSIGLGIVGAVSIFTIDELTNVNVFSSLFVMLGYAIIVMPYITERFWHRKSFKKIMALAIVLIIVVSIVVGYCILVISRNENNIAANIILIHLLIFTILYVLWVTYRLSGKFKTELICQVDNADYLVGTRHSGNVWSLHLCHFGKVEVPDGDRNTIFYEKSKYILRKFDEIEKLKTVYTPDISPVNDIKDIQKSDA